MADADSLQPRVVRALRWMTALWFLLLVLACYAHGEGRKRLILKDGSWQEITKYEANGDRVRYFSSPRLEWEEVPRELVDWPATETWNSRPPEKIADEEQDSSEKSLADELMVAPGLRLPRTGGIFLLDSLDGEPILVELNQDEGVLNRDSSGVFHSSIDRIGKLKQHLEIKGPHARQRIHARLPLIFIKIAESSVAPERRFRLVAMEPRGGSRIMANIRVTMGGKQSQTQEFIPARIENFHQGWLKVVPLQELRPGEYAVVETLDQDQLNSYAWDFGVDTANSRPDKADIGPYK